MHNLKKYVCDEIEDIDSKAKKGKLSQGELEYAKDMTELKKNILKCEMLEDGGHSNRSHSYYGGSYDGGSYDDHSMRKRDSMGRFARDGEYGDVYARDSYSRNSYGSIEKHLEDMARQEPDMGKRRKIENFLDELSRM